MTRNLFIAVTLLSLLNASVYAKPDAAYAARANTKADAPINMETPQKESKSALPLLTVYKSESCGCCQLWVEHMQKAGFSATVVNTTELSAIKAKFSVPKDLHSCHTASVGGYFVEGHVPASDVLRLLAEKPNVAGIGVAGMPMGSPGMEVPSGDTQPYKVTQVNKDGRQSIFSSHAK